MKPTERFGRPGLAKRGPRPAPCVPITAPEIATARREPPQAPSFFDPLYRWIRSLCARGMHVGLRKK